MAAIHGIHFNKCCIFIVNTITDMFAIKYNVSYNYDIKYNSVANIVTVHFIISAIVFVLEM